MRIRTIRDGRVFQGTPRQIIEAMQSIGLGQPNRSLGEYIDWLVDQVQRTESIDLELVGETVEERATSLIHAMIDAGLAAKM